MEEAEPKSWNFPHHSQSSNQSFIHFPVPVRGYIYGSITLGHLRNSSVLCRIHMIKVWMVLKKQSALLPQVSRNLYLVFYGIDSGIKIVSLYVLTVSRTCQGDTKLWLRLL